MIDDLTGAIDLHVHCSPDVRPRKMHAVELAHAAKSAGMRALLIKNHQFPTAPLVEILRHAVPGVGVFGGLVLNEAVGGFNVEAVDTALKVGAKQIWMPTRSAAHERAILGHPDEGLRIHNADGELRPAVREIVSLVARTNVILGTAHISPDEIVMLVREARAAGVRKILVNHPEIDFLRLTVSLQREIRGPDVFFERCYARKGFSLDWDGLARVTREIGYASTVLATDLGQPENPDPVSGLAEMRSQFSRRGFTDAELNTMLCENPARLLNLQ